jgi:hypothetical protein
MTKTVVSLGAIVTLAFVCFYPKMGRTDAGPNCHTVTKSNTKDAVECPAGEKVTGGGGSCYGFTGGWKSPLTKSLPQGNGWKVTCENVADGEEKVAGNVSAICCKF